MRIHLKIMFLTILIILLSIIVSYFYFNSEWYETEKGYSLIIYIIFWILCYFYPMGFYTCWRLISDDKYKGVFVYDHIMGPTTSPFCAIFIVPLILSPIFIPDYISYFKYDLKHHKDFDYNE